MAITTEAGYIAAKAAGSYKRIQKATIANAVAGGIQSMWRSTGPFPAQPAIPGAAALCDRNTPGALELPAVTGANTRYIDAFALYSTTAGQIRFVDRVIQNGSLNASLATAQPVATPALPARAPALSCDWFLEFYADTGATAANATVALTYTDATTANVVVILGATTRAARMLPITPGAGKVIASVQSVTLSVSTGAAAAFGITCQQDIGLNAVIMAANVGDKDAAMVQPMPADACLSLCVDCSTTNTGDLRGGYRIIEG